MEDNKWKQLRNKNIGKKELNERNQSCLYVIADK